jgi:hypothetical protein
MTIADLPDTIEEFPDLDEYERGGSKETTDVMLPRRELAKLFLDEVRGGIPLNT